MVKKLTVFMVAMFLSVTCISANDDSENNLFLTSNYAQQDETSQAKQIYDIPSTFEKVMESDALEVYLKRDTFALRIRNKESGYIYSSNLNEYAEAGLNNVWESYFESGVTIDYFDKNNNLKTVSISKVKTNKVNYKISNNKIEAEVDFRQQKIKLTVVLELDNDQLSMSLPYDKITDKDKILSSVIVLPGLGATKAKLNDGYFMLSDGVGALARFNEIYSSLSTPYSKTYYGIDYGIESFGGLGYNQADPATNEYPFYGVVHGINTNGFVNWVEQGAANATLLMYPAGVISDYFFITNRFNYRFAFKQPISEKEDVSAKMKDTFKYDAKEVYKFATDDANYVGLTNLYKSELIKQTQAKKLTIEQANIPLRINYVGSTLTTGFLDLKNQKLSTFKDVEKAYKYLHEKGIKNQNIVLSNFAPVFSSDPFDFIGAVGSKRDLESLSKQVLTNQNQLTIDLDLSWVKKGSLSIGSDAQRNVNGRFIGWTSGFGTKEFDLYAPNVDYLKNAVADALKAKESSLFTGIAIDAFINSDFNEKTQSREDNIKKLSKTLHDAQAKKSVETWRSTGYSLGNANATMYNYMSHSLYPYFTDTVPIVPILSSGYMQTYGNASINFSSDPQRDMLRSIEFQILPRYVLMTEPTSAMELYRIQGIGQFDAWKDQMVKQYQYIDGALQYTQGAQIVDYTVLAPGVNRVAYDNGYVILVNYQAHDFTYKDQVVKANDYLVVKEG